MKGISERVLHQIFNLSLLAFPVGLYSGFTANAVAATEIGYG
jgi:hypothetical protein